MEVKSNVLISDSWSRSYSRGNYCVQVDLDSDFAMSVYLRLCEKVEDIVKPWPSGKHLFCSINKHGIVVFHDAGVVGVPVKRIDSLDIDESQLSASIAMSAETFEWSIDIHGKVPWISNWYLYEERLAFIKAYIEQYFN